jgi:hypothetical protein
MSITSTATLPEDIRFSRRLGGWTGIAFAVVFAASFFVVDAPPEIDASAEEVKQYMLDNRVGGLVQTLLFAVAAPLFVAFVSGLRDRVAEGDVATRHLSRVAAVCGWLWVAVLIGGAGAFFAGVWVHDIGEAASADVLRLAWDIGYVEYQLANPLAAALVIIAGWCVLHGRSMPAWFGWASVLVGVVMVASTIGAVIPDAATVGFFVYVAFVVWALVGGILLVRQSSQT